MRAMVELDDQRKVIKAGPIRKRRFLPIKRKNAVFAASPSLFRVTSRISITVLRASSFISTKTLHPNKRKRLLMNFTRLSMLKKTEMQENVLEITGSVAAMDQAGEAMRTMMVFSEVISLIRYIYVATI